MKHIYLICLFIAASVFTYAGEDNRAKAILDQTAKAYREAGGINILFEGTQRGTLLLKGECFYLECSGVKSWFDGETQWSYVEENEEVTVSNPSPKELQSINPYSFIGLYKQGYQYHIGPLKQYKGNNITEINLQAENPQQNIQHATLYVSNKDGQPFFIKITDCNKNTNSIEINSLKKGLNLPDNRFVFDKKKYPQAEIIDLR